MNADERREQLVVPFYLKMMRRNVLWRVNPPLDSFVRAADAATPADVVALLGDAWRECAVGAWMALRHDTPDVRAALLRALASSFGSLTAPPLATAAVYLCGDESLTSLKTYIHRDVPNSWGAAGTIAAAIEFLGEEGTVHQPSDDDRAAFAGLMKYAERIKSAE